LCLGNDGTDVPDGGEKKGDILEDLWDRARRWSLFPSRNMQNQDGCGPSILLPCLGTLGR